ncbi:MAG TPA: CHAT domain-containing protein [Trebonia sp.]|nr:CHAT domain-containing protein [Trebonia sp.]
MTWNPDELLARALSKPSEALAEARQTLARHPPAAEAAVAHQVIGVVLRHFGDINEAVAELRKARQLAGKAGDTARESDILASLSVALLLAGQTKRSLGILNEVLRDSSSGVPAGRLLIRRCYAFWVLGRHAEALRDARSAVGLLRGAGDPVWEARALHHRATAYAALGRTDRADRDYARAETLYAACGQDLEYANAREERAAAAHASGDLPGALAHLDHARQLFEQLGVFEPEVAVNKCTVLLAAGLAGDALREVEAAVATIEQDGGSAARRAELLYSCALAATAAGDLDVARRRSAEALRLFRRQQRPWWAVQAELVLVSCRSASGDDSPSLLRAARKVAARLDELDAARAVDAHLLAGRLALARGRREEAGRHLRTAAAARNRGVPRTRCAGWLAQAIWCAGEERWRGMLAACDRGLALLDLHLRTLGATELRTLATAQGTELAEMALRYAAGREDPRLFLRWSERLRATAGRITPVRPLGDYALAADLAALRNVVARLESTPGSRGTAPALLRERHRLEAAVRQRALHAPAAASAAAEPFAVAGLLGELGDSDLIQLTDLDGQLHAVVAGAGRLRLTRVGSTAEATHALSRALFALRREGSCRGTGRLDLDEIGRRLEVKLLGQAVRLLRGGPVVVVPPGKLHAVPWGLLPSLRERPTMVAPSASAWLRARRAARPAESKVVLVGGPRLSTGDAEVLRLAAQYPDAAVLTGDEAVTERVMAAIDGAWLVHIAAHGTFRADSPLFSAVELTDGPLTVYDLERLRRAPHQVVLSSCNSALGVPVGADELLGLVSALISLGTAGVVASVVPVDDPAAIPLMLALHHHLRGGRGPAEALRLARHAAGPGTVARSTAHSFIALGT